MRFVALRIDRLKELSVVFFVARSIYCMERKWNINFIFY